MWTGENANNSNRPPESFSCGRKISLKTQTFENGCSSENDVGVNNTFIPFSVKRKRKLWKRIRVDGASISSWKCTQKKISVLPWLNATDKPACFVGKAIFFFFFFFFLLSQPEVLKSARFAEIYDSSLKFNQGLSFFSIVLMSPLRLFEWNNSLRLCSEFLANQV